MGRRERQAVFRDKIEVNEEIMDYETKYNALVGQIKKAYLNAQTCSTKAVLEDILSSLKESEDERIRNFIIECIREIRKANPTNAEFNGECSEAIAWLEKQESVASIVERCKTSWYNEGKIQGQIEGLSDEEKYQQGWHDALEKQGEPNPYSGTSFKYNGHTWGMCARDNGVEILVDGKIKERVFLDNEPTNDTDEEIVKAVKDTSILDMVEPKFHEGEWIIDSQGLTHQIERVVENVTTHTFGYDIVGGGYFNDDNEGVHLWTIEDAKDGDVLYSKSSDIEYIVMSKGINEHGNIDSYFRYNSIDGFGVDIPSVLSASQDNITPASKEQRDILFTKMKEAGYKWDADKKELKKISQRMVLAEAKEAMYDKPAWSEEDEYMLDETIQHLKELIRIDKAKHCACDVPYYQRDIDWLKSLKERMKGE